ncbi:unnamed protein product [Darwinula stevensoni]|uniref:UBX domain-containing protein n=1 Tax=Darwinula stevensoni TaxID=69355 RepID=A0A7R8ZXU8_9CRUS|nr:unnamed protein product [Darwinula stevensoni]CAG0879137.1 unnamed protein product [Darwinula stevensoni]
MSTKGKSTSKRKNRETSDDSNDDVLSHFCAITGASEKIGKNLLEACNGNLEMAVNMQLENDLGNRSRESGNSGNGEVHVIGEPGPSTSSDDVRPPIPPTREVLVDTPVYDYSSFKKGKRLSRSRQPLTVFDGFRDFQAESKRIEEMMSEDASVSSSKQKTLEDLFRPPLDLIFRGSFQLARDAGSRKKRWLMVNVQNVTEFSCQVLNRDIWSNDSVREFIREHFIFWQVYHDSAEGERYATFYKVNEWPYVAILDPRTGENLATWHKLDLLTFKDLVKEFLSSHPPLDGSPSPTQPRKKAKQETSIIDASEDSQLEAAIKASLVESQTSSQKETDSERDASEIETFDSDSEGLPPCVLSESGVKGKESALKAVKSEKKPALRLLKGQSFEANDECSQNSLSSEISDVPCDEKWKEYLGPETDVPSQLLLRLPDGKKKHVSMPNSSKLQAVIEYVGGLGFPSSSHELVLQFPRRLLLDMDPLQTLKTLGLFPSETIFIQQKSTESFWTFCYILGEYLTHFAPNVSVIGTQIGDWWSNFIVWLDFDDFHAKACLCFLFIICVNLVLIKLAWNIYGEQIADRFMKPRVAAAQGFQPPNVRQEREVKMSAIKAFFKKRKLEVKFKLAGEGKRLNSPSHSSTASTSSKTSQHNSYRSTGLSEGAHMAREAALKRVQQQEIKPVSKIRARALRELEAERKKGAESVSAEPLQKDFAQDSDEDRTVRGVFFRCQLLGDEVLPKEEMLVRIKEFLYEQLAEERALTAVLIIHTLNRNEEKVKQCVSTLLKILDNIIQDPSEPKYRKIRVQNKAFQEQVASMEGTIDFLFGAGFEEQQLPHQDATEAFYVFPPEGNIDTLKMLREALISAEPIKPELDRNMHVFYPSSTTVVEHMEIPPDFFIPSVADIRKEQTNRTEEVERLSLLRTKAMRDKEAMREAKKYRYSLIRIRFPDGFLLQGTFSVYEKFSAVEGFVREQLDNPDLPFILIDPLGHQLGAENSGSTLLDLHLAPALILNFLWHPDIAADVEAAKSGYLSSSALAIVQDL